MSTPGPLKRNANFTVSDLLPVLAMLFSIKEPDYLGPWQRTKARIESSMGPGHVLLLGEASSTSRDQPEKEGCRK